MQNEHQRWFNHLEKQKQQNNLPQSKSEPVKAVKTNSLNTTRSRKSRIVDECFLSEDSYLLGNSIIEKTNLYDLAMIMDEAVAMRSDLTYMAKMFGKSMAVNSYIGGQSVLSGEAIAIGSGVFNSAVITDNGGAIHSFVYGAAVIMEEALALKSHIGGSVVLAGTAIVDGITLEDNEYLTEGRWTRKPAHIRGSAVGLPLSITESINGRWTIGCTTYDFDFWMRHSILVQKATKLSITDINKYKHLLWWLQQGVDAYELQQQLDKNNA